MSSWVKTFCLVPALASILALSACGFIPLYGSGQGEYATAPQRYFDDIYIENIPDREGVYLRNALIDRLYRTGQPVAPLFTLTVAPVAERITDLDITKDSDATRAQLRLTTSMKLIARGTGKTVLQRDLSAITSYNILQSQFTTRVSEDNARQNGLDDLARQIETQLALYFR